MDDNMVCFLFFFIFFIFMFIFSKQHVGLLENC